MRGISVACVAVIGHVIAMPGQLVTSVDSARVARALIAYAVAHPIGAGGSHGAMTALAVDSAASRWDALLGQALRQVAPALWLEPSSVAARTQPHLRVRTATSRGDSLVVETVWSWCFPSGGGESGWPVTYVLEHHVADWRVATAQIVMVGHGPRCEFDQGGAR